MSKITLTESAVHTSDWNEEKIIIGLDEENQPVYQKDLYIDGIFAQADIANGNRRIYPLQVLTEAVDGIQSKIITNSAIGEMGHPDYPGLKYERACILTTQLRMDGNNAMGRAKVLKSVPLGKLLEGLIKDGVRIGVSSRGRGSVDSNSYVRKGFKFVTPADVVPDPSAPDAFVQAIEESKSWLINESMMSEETYDGIRQDILESKNSNNFDKRKFEILQEFVNRF